MSLKSLIKSIKIGQLKQLLIWFFKHPLFLSVTVLATLETLKIAQQEFPNIHGKHNKANAFRHALWNALIAKRCMEFSNNLTKVMQWTATFTTWHEDFMLNEKLPRLMDLHNNCIGREFFIEFQNKSTSEIVIGLKDRLQFAIKINNEAEFKQYPRNLIYLE